MSVQMSRLVRATGFAASLLATVAGVATAQRSRGTMGTPRVVPGPTAPSAPGPSLGRANASGPRHPSAGTRRPGDLPRIVGAPPRRERSGSGVGSGYSTGFGGSRYNSGHSSSPSSRGTRYWRRPAYTRWGVGAGCGVACIGLGGRSGAFYGSFMIGYPFAVPIVVPYFAGATYERYTETVVDHYDSEPEPEPARGASKLIVIGGGTGGGGDALTVETVADSVRLSWLGAGRAAREVTLFVADSTQRRLATRSASPSAPSATFEVATLSAPVAYAGVAVTFADGVTSITLVPYRGGTASGQRR
jgi:hypothetical protein